MGRLPWNSCNLLGCAVFKSAVFSTVNAGAALTTGTAFLRLINRPCFSPFFSIKLNSISLSFSISVSSPKLSPPNNCEIPENVYRGSISKYSTQKVFISSTGMRSRLTMPLALFFSHHHPLQFLLSLHSSRPLH
uniref:Uncharacterized protein n=1 Tax=Opuntia streptacantha TaxID=393608 RepID=A0A7C8Z132_OPUST